MDKQQTARTIVYAMMAEDAFSQGLGIDILQVEPGYVKLQMEITPDMSNGFKVTHGAVTYALADSALAFASNSHGRVALALENNISYTRKVNPGDILTAETEELSLGQTMGVYNIRLTNQEGEKVALFRGTVYRTREQHEAGDSVQ